MSNVSYAGIDVSLEFLTVAVKGQPCWDKPLEFANNKDGHKQLLRFLKRCGQQIHVCLEPTSNYHLRLSSTLHKDKRCTVHLADPKAVKDFISCHHKGVKTDHTDARELVEYLIRMEPRPWQPHESAALSLRCLARRAENVTRRCTALKCQQHAARHGMAPPALLRDLKQELDNQLSRLKRLRAEMKKLVNGDAELKHKFQLLLSVKGVGEVTGLRMLGELSNLPEGLGKRQWVNAAGLHPNPQESGKSVHKPRRISKRGNKHLRQSLYMPALVATQHCPEVKEYYVKLQQRTKAKLAALCAVMRKLLQAIWGMLNTDTPFDPSLFCQAKS
jgi:transposase